MNMSEFLLEVNNLKKYFKTPYGLLHAVDDLSFKIKHGETLCIVGESGCGKTTTGRCILRLIEPTSGQVIFDGVDITSLDNRSLRKIRNKMQIIFQDPFSSLDPNQTILQTISEAVRTRPQFKTRASAENRVLEIMNTVGLAERLINSYPHELDGGRRQRIGIARAIAMEPKFIVCDEPVSALDVSIQAQILNLLEELQKKFGLTFIFITHDLAVVHHIADEIIVMYLGVMVEQAKNDELFNNPLHPYTKALLSAIPVPETDVKKDQILLEGEVASPINPGNLCRFAPRCEYAMDICRISCPIAREILPGHFVACHLY